MASLVHVLLLLLLALAQAATADSGTVVLYVGTYTKDEGWVHGAGRGIYSFAFDTTAGSLKPLYVALDAGANPSFVSGTTSSAEDQFVYAVNEVSEVSASSGTTTGYVVAISVGARGSILKLNRRETQGAAPAHVSVSPDRDFVLVSNYDGGSLALFPVQADGSLASVSDVHTFNQSVSHLHSTLWLPGSDFVVAADLGTDSLLVFTLDKDAKTLVPVASATVTTTSGSGPRHMVLDPQLKFLYVINELSSTIAVYALDTTQSKKPLASKPVQEISTLPSGFNKTRTPAKAADIHITSDGKFVFATTRGADLIAVYQIKSAETGTLNLVGFESTRGTTPRSLLVFRSFVLVANQDSSSIVVFALDQTTGNITYTGTTVACPTPVSLFIAQDP